MSTHSPQGAAKIAGLTPARQRALDVPDKTQRVANFHRATLHELAELTAAAGLDHPNDFQPLHIWRRVSPREVITFAEIYPAIPEGALLTGNVPPRWSQAWAMADAHSFRAVT